MARIFPVILSGGSGTRLWPLSRAMYPKQFIRFLDGQDASFLGATLRRLSERDGFEPPCILCNNDHRFLVIEELEAANISARAIMLEPVARNTAPAIAVAAEAALREEPGAVLAVMPSDHQITDEAAFRAQVARAAELAATGKLVLFGVEPASPHTGYGYIRRGPAIEGFDDAYAVDSFFEKPDAERAKNYCESGVFYWNSGIFVLHARTLIEELETHAPAIMEAARRALDASRRDLGFIRLDPDAFAAALSISIDHAVMEKTGKAAVLPLNAGWSDIGSWSSLWEISQRDAQDNHISCDAVLDGTSGSYIHSEKALVSAIGVKDLVIVDTPDALLVADRHQAHKVADIVEALKAQNRQEHSHHVRSFRPWGYFETLNAGPRFQVKLLHIKPGAQLSLQMHHHRSEHWVVVVGTARVQIEDRELFLSENESVYISATQWHRLENPGKVPLEIIEVQIGTYLQEDDIIRRDDIYLRDLHE